MPIDISERIRLQNVRIRRMLKEKYNGEWEFIIEGGRPALKHIAQEGKPAPTEAEQAEVLADVKALGMQA